MTDSIAVTDALEGPRMTRTQDRAVTLGEGRITSIEPGAAGGARRLLMPGLVNAHDHCRPLSPTSFGGANKPLETWLLRLTAMPATDPYLAALAAFGRAARTGCVSIMAHYAISACARLSRSACATATRSSTARQSPRSPHCRPPRGA